MDPFQKYSPLLSDSWKEKYGNILAEEHLEKLNDNLRRFKDKTLDWDLPYFKEEIKISREESFNLFISLLESNRTGEIIAGHLEEIPFEHWLNILGQRITPASIRDGNAIPPLKEALIESCLKPFNTEITVAQRAWEKHAGRRDLRFWGEVKGSNRHKQENVMQKSIISLPIRPGGIFYIITSINWFTRSGKKKAMVYDGDTVVSS